MKLNFISKLYIAITLILVLAIVAKFFNYKSWDRYSYLSSVCMPESYPIAIHNSYFILADGDLGYIKDEDVDNSTGKIKVILKSLNLKVLPAKSYTAHSLKYAVHDTRYAERTLKQGELISVLGYALKNDNYAFELAEQEKSLWLSLHLILKIKRENHLRFLIN